MPNYEDASGSLSRRLLIFLCETIVTERDTTLKERILKTELPIILLRCISKYRKFLEANRGKDVLKDCLPQSMIDAREDAKEELDPVRHFISTGSEEKEIIHDSYAETPIREFDKAFREYQKERRGFSRPLKGDDHGTISACGFNIVTLNSCKICGALRAVKSVCGDHYHLRNRSKKVVIVGMKIRLRRSPSAPIARSESDFL